MGRLANHVALITGGGSGVGLATARLFLAEGAQVAIAGRDAAKLAQAAAELAGGDRVFHHAADVSEPDQAVALIQAVEKRFGRIDILVNNAGTNLKERTMKELSIEGWQRLMRTNLDGAFYCIRAALPGMRERRSGVVVNINSVSGLRAHPLGGAAYNASKFGLTALATTLAAEEKDNGIRVSSIFPGEIDTPILAFRPSAISEDHRKTIMKPEDVASAVLFVASLPAHVSVPELVIKPTAAMFV
jgi:NAD(P)-dependent dehydrogenase (short-subunit alcohol dehydrogenase family)